MFLRFILFFLVLKKNDKSCSHYLNDTFTKVFFDSFLLPTDPSHVHTQSSPFRAPQAKLADRCRPFVSVAVLQFGTEAPRQAASKGQKQEK